MGNVVAVPSWRSDDWRRGKAPEGDLGADRRAAGGEGRDGALGSLPNRNRQEDSEVGDLFPKAQTPLFRASEAPTEAERRESGSQEAAAYDPYSWVQDKSTQELLQIGLEQAQYAKAPTHEEFLAEYEADKKAWFEKGHRRVMARPLIRNIIGVLELRGASSAIKTIKLVLAQYDEVMNPPARTTREEQEEQAAIAALLQEVLDAARQDAKKNSQAYNRAVSSEGQMQHIAKFAEDEVRSKMRNLGFPDALWEPVLWPLAERVVELEHRLEVKESEAEKSTQEATRA
jgi:hypothetical protein